MRVNLETAPVMVHGDRVRLQQVVSNLLTNAIKFTPDGGRVTIELGSAEGCARVVVADNGNGIADSFLPHVFNRFAQENSTHTRARGGLGLGLAIVRHILEAHGGTACAASPGIGKGSTFSVTLPLTTAKIHDTLPPESAVTVLPPSGASKPAYESALRDVRILVLDDDSGTREAVAELLKQTGARVCVAESAAGAMAIVDEFQPAVLVCDIALPSEDGYTFIQRLRVRDPARGGATPALALTALAGDGDRRRALAAGFQMHLAKPIDINRLKQAVLDLVTPAS